MQQIDLRSDTVTNPTPEMRQAMVDAMVGDDVYEDDITTNELQKYAAELTGKEDALFVPSGCFGNQVCIMTHTQRGDEILVNDNSHIIQYELGAASFISGVMTRTLACDENGKMDLDDVNFNIRKGYDVHFPTSKLLCLEQPSKDGYVFDLKYLEEMYNLAKKNNLYVHLDGARIFNAASYLNIDVKEITKYCDSVMICLSKGLCSPAGSLVCGSKDFIFKARYNRKCMGGGMRQTGVLAAAGLISLQKHTQLLDKDYQIAQYIGKQLNEKLEKYIEQINLQNYHINMLFFKLKENIKIQSQDLIKYLQDKHNVLMLPEIEPQLYRIVTHYYIQKEQADIFIKGIQDYLDNNVKL
ncbi:Pyridoxal phosphate-dependent transferase [Pseudocohnilembus persalinus]|uniref:Pyridoxal phosphate-dependent transferase n=1 Tax=Pseudocohnilembus persalinus TaxID=266149 RepID=A0A0V0R1S4_PSEPJ|nr:Pyridoxal phosphate-dependent transferase [Pseudocohnilembus persalinus]|eukprot:KRX08473.1 Pyridoxal phosphate-dependent transferase [Pseudocohnilembus persalinus]